MKNVNFRPRVGENYSSEGFNGNRILVLGESHYCKKELSPNGICFPLCKKENMKSDCFSQTQDVLDYFVYSYNGEKYLQTFLCFERAVLGKELSQKERERFWNSVIFYNYIQYSQKGPRQHLQQDTWEQSELAFKEVLEFYMPDCIIVWGARLYNYVLPNWDRVGSKLYINDTESTDIWTYTINGKKIPAMKVHHPSTPTGKDWHYWHEFYKKFLRVE